MILNLQLVTFNLHHFDIYINPRWQTQISQCFNHFRVRIDDVDEALVDAHLELLARVLVDE